MIDRRQAELHLLAHSVQRSGWLALELAVAVEAVLLQLDPLLVHRHIVLEHLPLALAAEVVRHQLQHHLHFLRSERLDL